MDFTFSEDQLLFQQSVREFLVEQVTTEYQRGHWETETGRDAALWKSLAELGLTGLTVPEAHGGLGLGLVDFVLLAQECGYVALSENLVDTVMVAVPLLLALDNTKFNQTWLPKIAAGDLRVALGHHRNRVVADAHVADLVLMQHADELHALTPEQFSFVRNESVDPGRRLFSVDWKPSKSTCLAQGAAAQRLWQQALNHGAVGAAAQQLGLAQRMIDLAVQYTGERQQFGKAIGSFQAVKHLLADVAVRLEYAKAPVYRAAWSLGNVGGRTATQVSHAKLAAGDAALLAARNTMQVHGAMGYTWEVDLHIFMKRAWALDGTWGDRAFHKQRVAEFVLSDTAPLGAGETFVI